MNINRLVDDNRLEIFTGFIAVENRLGRLGPEEHILKEPVYKQAKDLRVLEGHYGRVGTVTFSPDRQLLVSGSDDKTVWLWDAEYRELLRTMKLDEFMFEGFMDTCSFLAGRQWPQGSEKTLRCGCGGWKTGT